MEEWAVLTPSARDQKFNTCDNSAFTWEACWPRIAGWYGIGHTGPDTNPDTKWIEKQTRFNPRGYGDKGVSRRKFTFVEWAKRPEVVRAWREIAEQNEKGNGDGDGGLTQKGELKDVERVFGFLDGTVCRPAPLIFRYVFRPAPFIHVPCAGSRFFRRYRMQQLGKRRKNPRA
jgi:hypothetical protein